MGKLKFRTLMLITSKWIMIESNSAFSKFSRCLPFSKWLPKHGIKKWEVEIQHCPISSKFDMWVDNDVPN